MAFSRNHALVMVTPDDPAYENKPSDWNAGHALSGADVGGIPYCPTATTETTSANLTFNGTTTLRLGGAGGINFTNDGNATYFDDLNGSSTWNFRQNGTAAFIIGGASAGTYSAGAGVKIIAGTAATDVNALSATQTWNAAGVAFVAKDLNVTNTASAAGALLERWRVGGSAVASISKAGLFDATAFSVAGAAGADFGPGAVTSITVVKGIVTAIS